MILSIESVVFHNKLYDQLAYFHTKKDEVLPWIELNIHINLGSITIFKTDFSFVSMWKSA